MVRGMLFLFAAALLLIAVTNVQCEDDDGPVHHRVIDALLYLDRADTEWEKVQPKRAGRQLYTWVERRDDASLDLDRADADAEVQPKGGRQLYTWVERRDVASLDLDRADAEAEKVQKGARRQFYKWINRRDDALLD
ncbi:uncharacterized protein LOC134804636 [Cydia splendana]|uniref:uncharacterized protein LOC134804636 n=1 Tax=Cydia splendana TaxID=1100963 RepID=UPI0028F4AC4D